MLLVILISSLFSHTSWAASPTGLNDADKIRFGAVLNTTFPDWPTGGINICIMGHKNPPGPMAQTRKIRGGNACVKGVFDYALVVQSYPDSDVSRTELSNSKGFISRLESFSKEVPAKLINDAVAKAAIECPDCKRFYLLAEMENILGFFDILPIQNYKGFHSLNSLAGYSFFEDNNKNVTGFEVNTNFLEYDQR